MEGQFFGQVWEQKISAESEFKFNFGKKREGRSETQRTPTTDVAIVH